MSKNNDRKSQHYIDRCSCGAVIAQCRCPSRDKKQTIVPNGCPECIAKERAGATPAEP